MRAKNLSLFRSIVLVSGTGALLTGCLAGTPVQTSPVYSQVTTESANKPIVREPVQTSPQSQKKPLEYCIPELEGSTIMETCEYPLTRQNVQITRSNAIIPYSPCSEFKVLGTGTGRLIQDATIDAIMDADTKRTVLWHIGVTEEQLRQVDDGNIWSTNRRELGLLDDM